MAAARNYALVLILLVSSLTSCKDDNPSDNFGDGSGLKGKINVQNEFQQPLYNERSGIKVFLEVGFRDFEVVADNVGNWQLAGAPVGAYTITYSKEGYSTIVRDDIVLSYTNPNYQLDNRFQKLPSVTITKLPLTDFTDFELALNSTPVGQDTVYTLNLSATMLPAPPPTGQAKGYRLFIGEDEDVSPTNYIYQEYEATTTAAISKTYNNEWFTSLGLSSGDAIYAAIYGDVSFNLEVVADSVMTFPNLSALPGGMASVVLP
ncbi:carboxypeptidase regulatory-like domain-containing protein [Cryomorpha ignava]|uniref:Carboxypeptidase regulatory-like domain-containing protein n=1 Tax=Cryomorpha ignava TaxID=101383 RepID=A0A7K3WVC0_9FLAO|nr:carboxypeptidase-like regulatory domain-containing protein [Cryomorpha ignava]NEN25434.1 carboxypeptidase regulatory-like domain-containing protein [Cryomorpha ignava]